jgi:cell division protein FtsZ
MAPMASYRDLDENPACIKVVGVGGGGGNAVNRMIEAGVGDVEFIAANTDAKALSMSKAPTRLLLDLHQGLGSGGDPEKGARAADHAKDELRAILQGADMVFVTAGMGGGTGTGGSPIVAEVASELDALTVAVVTKPFRFEGRRRAALATEGLKKLAANVDTLIAIENDRLLEMVGPRATVEEAFAYADDILRQGIQGISEIITEGGTINVDFADVRSIMEDGGAALMAIGKGSGDERVLAAVRQATQSPLLGVRIAGAKGMLFNVKAGTDFTPHELDYLGDQLQEHCAPDANVIFGVVFDEALKGKLQLTVIATGFALDADANVTAPPVKKPEVHTLAGMDPRTGLGRLPDVGPGRIVTGGSGSRGTGGSDESDVRIPPFLRRKTDDKD